MESLIEFVGIHVDTAYGTFCTKLRCPIGILAEHISSPRLRSAYKLQARGQLESRKQAQGGCWEGGKKRGLRLEGVRLRIWNHFTNHKVSGFSRVAIFCLHPLPHS